MSAVLEPHICSCELGYHQDYEKPHLDNDLEKRQLVHTNKHLSYRRKYILRIQCIVQEL